MGEAWSLYAWFGGITVIATAAGVLIYRFANRNPWPLSTRVGTALGGAAAGTLGGMMLGGALHLDEPVSAALTFALAVGLAVAMQRDLFAWTHDGQL